MLKTFILKLTGFTDFIGNSRSPFSSAISRYDRPFDLFFGFCAPPGDAGCEKGDRSTQQKGECKGMQVHYNWDVMVLDCLEEFVCAA